jgi:hypothetical protein
MHVFSRSIAFVLVLAALPIHAAECPRNLADLLVGRNGVADLERALVRNDQWLEPQVRSALELYERRFSPEAGDALHALFPKAAALAVLADEELLQYSLRFAELLKKIDLTTRGTPQAKLTAAAKKLLKDKVPAASVEGRIAAYAAEPNLKNLRRLLGELELDEANELLHGGNPLRPTPDSRIGKFLAETGAASRAMAFPKGPRSQSKGAKRLVVALDSSTEAAYKKHFADILFFTHVHSPQQGTLQVMHELKVGSYARFQNDFRMPSPGALLPMAVLNSREGQRMAQYARMGQINEANRFAQQPWQLSGYCATGGYSSCTHWVGNIPIGDRMVRAYEFPGYVDDYADALPGETRHSRAPRVQDLRRYNLDLVASNFQGSAADRLRLERLVKRVWKAPEGSEQLADAFGLRAANLAGELANPGYVAYSLIGKASQERVPVVFLTVDDARRAIPASIDLQIDAH